MCITSRAGRKYSLHVFLRFSRTTFVDDVNDETRMTNDVGPVLIVIRHSGFVISSRRQGNTLQISEKSRDKAPKMLCNSPFDAARRGILKFPPHMLPPESEPQTLIVFRLDDRRYALRPEAVEHVVRMVEIAALPKAPAIVLGVVNVRGSVAPVFDIRRRFGLPERAVALSDHLLIARAGDRRVALAVDEALDVIAPLAAEICPPERVLPGLEYVTGVVRLEDGLLFIHDLDAFLSADESAVLDRALAEQAS